MKTLSWWWPTAERLNDVLLSDAEAHSPAVALAVHQRMHIRRRHHDDPIDTDRADVVDEGAILKQLEDPVPDGCQVVLIEGKSGTGKSHVVRWLEIQLDRKSKDAQPRVVLPVSKGARLRDIVKTLCDRPELAGDEHAGLRQQLARAQEPIEPTDAASRLCQQLAFVCEMRARDATRKVEEGRALSELESLQREWGDKRALPHVLIYNPLRPLFVGAGGPMRRLVEHLHTKADPLDRRADQEFIDSDLEFDELPDELDDRARKVLGRFEDPETRAKAVRVLNDALDEAKRTLLHLNPGVVQEVFKSIRRELLRQNKELVLLVEDFADLSGLQREVLQASIQTGSPGGVRTYCTLRTVLAYTDGFLKEQTVLSRAQHVYYVPNQLDEKAVIEQSIRLVASYLRAARFGAAALNDSMRDAGGADQWLPEPPEVGEKESAILDAFEKRDGVPLFPFSPRTVERLVRDTYAGKASLLFVPRDVVRDVMPKVLQHRTAFLEGSFPSDAFRPSREAQLTEDQTKWLKKVNPTGAFRQRLESFLLYWGLNPGAAKAFGLPQPDVTDDRSTTDTVTVSDLPPKSSRRGPEPRAPSTELFAAERTLFESWRAGTDIASLAERNNIRKAIDVCVRPSLAWAWRPRIDKSSVFNTRWREWHQWIDIAGLRLASDAQVPLTVVTKDEREDKLGNESLVKELVAIYGSASLKTWDVDGVEHPLAAHLGFVERHRPLVERHLLGMWHSRKWDALPFLVSALTITGAILGVPKCGSTVPAEFVDMLFADPPEFETHDSAWGRTVATPLRAVRRALRELLEKEIGAFQGDGATVHAVDAARLLPFVPSTRDQLPALPPVPSFPPGAASDPDIKLVLETAAIIGTLDAASVTELDSRRTIAARVRLFLGDGLDKEAVASALASAIKELKQLDALTEARASEARSLVTALKKAAVVDPLNSVDRLVANDAPLWQRLVSLGRNESDIIPLARTLSLLERVDELLREHERNLTGSAMIDPLDEALAAHEVELAKARALFAELAPSATAPDAPSATAPDAPSATAPEVT